MVFSADAIIGEDQKKDFFIGIDSDGCAFDTMEIKYKECVIPSIIVEWDLQVVSKYVREAAEFVNLYSKWRGINRFPALINVFDLLDDRDEVVRGGFKSPRVDSLRKWTETAPRLDNTTLEKAVRETKDPLLARTLKWSYAVDEAIAKTAKDATMFPFVKPALDKMQTFADVLMISDSSTDTEGRPKKELLARIKEKGYKGHQCLMIGDDSGDLKAARANRMLFFPVNPGDEATSWQRFYEEAFGKFLSGSYAGAYEEKLIAEFDKFLPSVPPWKKT